MNFTSLFFKNIVNTWLSICEPQYYTWKKATLDMFSAAGNFSRENFQLQLLLILSWSLTFSWVCIEKLLLSLAGWREMISTRFYGIYAWSNVLRGNVQNKTNAEAALKFYFCMLFLFSWDINELWGRKMRRTKWSLVCSRTLNYVIIISNFLWNLIRWRKFVTKILWWVLKPPLSILL